VRRDGSKVLVAVKDTGIGIPRSEQKKIFEKFFRGEDSLVHETKGSGLGLALVRHIMEAHGGAVEVESTRQGSLHLASRGKSDRGWRMRAQCGRCHSGQGQARTADDGSPRATRGFQGGQRPRAESTWKAIEWQKF
jgi:signal transduction histidine kinase